MVMTVTEDDDGDTTSTALRWRYTNDLLAALLIGTLCVAVLYDVHLEATLSSNLYTALALESALAAVWAFGVETVTALKQLRA